MLRIVCEIENAAIEAIVEIEQHQDQHQFYMEPADHQSGGIQEDQDYTEEYRGQRSKIAPDLKQATRDHDQSLAGRAHLLAGERKHRGQHQQIADPDDYSEQMKDDCTVDEAHPINHRPSLSQAARIWLIRAASTIPPAPAAAPQRYGAAGPNV